MFMYNSNEKLTFALVFWGSNLIIVWIPNFVQEVCFVLFECFCFVLLLFSTHSKLQVLGRLHFVSVNFKCPRISPVLLESVFAEHEFSNTLQLWAFSSETESLSQTLKTAGTKIILLWWSCHRLCSDMVTKKIACFEGCKNKAHQGNGKRTESRTNITDLPVQRGHQQSWENENERFHLIVNMNIG